VRVGLDSYSYHRFFGLLRPGERPSSTAWRDGVGEVVDEAERLGVGAVSLQTCFIGPPDERAARALALAASRLEVALSWGAPDGIVYGSSDAALDELLAWLSLAEAAGVSLVRIVLGGPAQRGLAASSSERVLAALRRIASCAGALGIRVAVENHGDISAADLLDLIERAHEPGIGVCLDTGNALRVGDDLLAAARLLAPHVLLVHLKDIEEPAREADPIAGPCSVRYGSGVVPLAETLAVLAAAGFDGLVSLELGQIGPGDEERELVASGLSWFAQFANQRQT
jgi:sugar phosphate isomerase/epimerase